MNDQPFLLEVENLKVHFPIRNGLLLRQTGVVKAVDGVSFAIAPGETLGLVGESGCGKSTTGLALMQLLRKTAGEIRLGGRALGGETPAELKALRTSMQIVFQDPFSSLNPRQPIGRIIRAPLDIHAVGAPHERRAKVLDLMNRVGLRPDHIRHYPHQLSGGQRQRVGIARALAIGPRLLICDEPVSALDVSVQAQILNLLATLRRDLGLSYLFISHDLDVVRHVSDRVAVMYLGRIVELATCEQLFADPRHPYTELLLRSAPPSHPRERRGFTAMSSEPQSRGSGEGCAFQSRCPLASDRCRIEAPSLLDREGGRRLACHNR